MASERERVLEDALRRIGDPRMWRKPREGGMGNLVWAGATRSGNEIEPSDPLQIAHQALAVDAVAEEKDPAGSDRCYGDCFRICPSERRLPCPSYEEGRPTGSSL